MVSVIVPIYNADKYLCRCIDSILDQSYKDFELLLVDDGSTDGSAAICDEYAGKDSRIKVFHKQNGGVSSARNVGLNYAKGDWISFIDSDDYVNINFLLDFVNDETEIDELIVQGFFINKQNHSKSIVRYSEDIKSISESLDILCHHNLPGTIWNKLFKRRILNIYTIRFKENYKFKEDELFLLEYICHIHEVKFKYSTNYQYIEPNWNDKYILNDIDVLKECFSIVENYVPGVLKYTLYYFFNPYVDAVIESFLVGSGDWKSFDDIYCKIKYYERGVSNRTAKYLCKFPLPLAKVGLNVIRLIKHAGNCLKYIKM